MFETTYKMFELVPHSMLTKWAEMWNKEQGCLDPYWAPNIPGSHMPPKEPVVRLAAFAQERTFRINIQSAPWVGRPSNGAQPGYYYKSWNNTMTIRWIPSKCRFDFLTVTPPRRKTKNFSGTRRRYWYASPVGFYKVLHDHLVARATVYYPYQWAKDSPVTLDADKQIDPFFITELGDINELMSMIFSWMCTVSGGQFNPWEIEAPEIDRSLKNNFAKFHQWALVLANYPIMRHFAYSESYLSKVGSKFTKPHLVSLDAFASRVPALCQADLDAALNVVLGVRADYKYRGPKSMKKLFVHTVSRVDNHNEAYYFIELFGVLARVTRYNYNQMRDILTCIHSTNTRGLNHGALVQLRNTFSHPKVCRILAEPNGLQNFQDSVRIIHSLALIQINETLGSFSAIKDVHDRLVEIERAARDRRRALNRQKYEEELSQIKFSSNWYTKMEDSDLTIGPFKVIKPDTAWDLDQWGAELHCCVGSYVSQVSEGHSMIVAVTQDDKLTAAIEVVLPSKEIRQFLGNRNSTLHEGIVVPIFTLLREKDLIAPYTGGHGVRHLQHLLEGYVTRTIAKYGIHEMVIPDNCTVANVRDNMIHRCSMPENAIAYIAGNHVVEDYVIPPGTQIFFMKRQPDLLPLNLERVHAF